MSMSDRCGQCLNCIEVAELAASRPCKPVEAYWDHDTLTIPNVDPLQTPTVLSLRKVPANG